MRPTITLLVPCYNAAPFLLRLLESVRALTQPFTAILCYDDGSTDDTVAVARSLGLDIITGHPNKGVAHARNQLAAAARTEWIHFHDADDLIAATFLERLSPWCGPANEAVTCDADWLDAQSRRVVISWRYDPVELARVPMLYLLGHPMSLNNTIIRRDAWLAVGGCDETLTMWEDADIHFRLARNGARFHHVAEVLTYALRRGESFSHNYRKSWLCRLSSLERYATDPSSSSIGEILAQEAEKAAAELAGLGEAPGAKRAIALCRRLGGHPPTSRHPVVRVLKLFVPAYSLLRWKAHRRNRGT